MSSQYRRSRFTQEPASITQSQTVNYTGDGSLAARVIKLSFTPKLVFIVESDTPVPASSAQSGFAAGSIAFHQFFTNSSAGITNFIHPSGAGAGILAVIVTNGVDVGAWMNNTGFLNTLGITYQILAFG